MGSFDRGRLIQGFLIAAAAAAGCTGQIGSPSNPPLPGGSGGSGPDKIGELCVASTGFAPPRIWRLNDQQYRNVVHDVFGSTVAVPLEVSEARSNGAEDLTRADSLAINNDTTASNYLNSAHTTAVSAAANLDKLLPCAVPDAVCVETFIRNKVARAFRRPVTDTEVRDMLALFQLGAADGPAEGLRVLMEYVLQAPAFLWRTEVGMSDPAASAPATTPQPLGTFEVAGALAFLFLNSAPDDALWAKATAGTLTNPGVLAAEIDRLMALPAAKANLASQVGSWLAVRKTAATEKDSRLFPEFTASVKDALTQSVQLFLQDVIFAGKLSDLITSRKMFLNQELATLYGVSGVSGAALVGVDVNTAERSGGILTHPALLAANARIDRGDPIHRGLFIYTSMVCGGQVPDPPANANAVDQSLPATASERERAEFRASRSDCSVCHVRFDPLGLLTERYDPIGRYREKDAAGRVIDQRATISVGTSADGPADGLADLVTRLRSSREFSDCAAGKLAAIAVGRTVKEDNSCALKKVQDDFASSGSFLGLFRSIATSPAFLTRDGQLQ